MGSLIYPWYPRYRCAAGPIDLRSAACPSFAASTPPATPPAGPGGNSKTPMS